jgi:Zn-dependent protease
MWQEITPDYLVMGLGWYAVFLIAITCHEAAHAWAAYRLGDPTAYFAGQVTLNPTPHIEREPIGTILMPILSYWRMGVMLGWASAPYDPYWAAKYPRRALAMAMAGPAANLILAVLSAGVLRVSYHAGWLGEQDPESFFGATDGLPGTAMQRVVFLFWIMFQLNLILFVFNLLPLPPLDGSAIWPLVLAPGPLARYYEFRAQPAFVMIALFVAWGVFPKVFQPINTFALRLLRFGIEGG